jgi:hypothetical protein
MPVTQETDFLDLYRQLDVSPGCDVSELKQAYRRRVATLHPDRQPKLAGDPHASARLQRLTAQFGAAMEFHRRHGRLPGAPAMRSAHVRAANDGAPRVGDPFVVHRAMPQQAAEAFHANSRGHAPGRRRHSRLAALLVVVALLVLAWSMYSISSRTGSGGIAEESALPVDTGAVARGHPVDAPVLRLGMSAEDVRAIEGDPLSTHGDLWEYGPSWVRFDHDQVVNWHSSPLRALHTVERPAQVSGP